MGIFDNNTLNRILEVGTCSYFKFT